MVTVESGALALEYAITHPVVLFLLDVQMPEMDGFELAELIRQNERHQDVPILFITAIYKSDEFARKGFDVGAYDYITKPVTDNELLLNKVKIFLQLYRQQRELEHLNHSLEDEVKRQTTELVAAKQRELELESRRKIEEKEKEKEKEIQAREIAWLQREKLFMEGVVSAVPAGLLVLRNGVITAVNSRFRQLFTFEPNQGDSILPVLAKIGLNPQQIERLHRRNTKEVAEELEVIHSENDEIRVLDIRSSGFIFEEEEEEEEEEVVILLSIGDVTEQRRLEERQQYIAFQSGLAEMSMSVLHNIGNVLMGIQHQSERILEGGTSLQEIANLLQQLPQLAAKQNRESGEGDLTPPMKALLKASQQTGEDLNQLYQTHFSSSADRIYRGIQHIEEIITIQRGASELGGGSSEVSLHRLVEDARTLLADLCGLHQVQVVQKIDERLPMPVLPRSPLLQLLINLIKNSCEAIVVRHKLENKQQTDGETEGRITIEAESHQEQLRLCIVDNGIGIAPERLQTIFQFGFSTKKEGGGIGLHAGTLFVNKLGGTITAFSDGVGAGATVEILLPLNWQPDADEQRED